MTYRSPLHDFPADFLQWAGALRHRYFHGRRLSRRVYTFTLAPPLLSRLNTQPVLSSFTLIPEDILRSENWRRDVAQRIRALKIHIQRQHPICK